jgi:ABC-type transport system involved in multi-copper enzyme maturation permease subunit
VTLAARISVPYHDLTFRQGASCIKAKGSSVIGPVLYQELLLASRRTRQYVFRWIYAGWMVLQLLGLAFVYMWATILSDDKTSLTMLVCGALTPVLIVQQLILLVITTPVLVAGAVTDEKSRGTLQYLLTTDLTASNVILGKWIARVFQVCVLYLTSLPLFCFVGVLGGLEWTTLLGLNVMWLLTVSAMGAASLLASVWSRRTRDAVLSLLLVLSVILGINWLLGNWLLQPFIRCLDPLYALEPALASGDWPGLRTMMGRILLAILISGILTIGCLSLAAWRLRPAYLRQLQNEGQKKKQRWWHAKRSAIGDDPIRWKDRQVEGIAPLPIFRQIPGWVGIALVLILTVISCGTILYFNLPPGTGIEYLVTLIAEGDIQGLVNKFSQIAPCDEGFMYLGLVVVFLASLVVGIRCSGAISGERERQTWEALLLTPMETRLLVRGKLRGIMGATYPYLRVYAVPAVLLSLAGGLMSFFWITFTLTVAFLAMYFVGAAGIWCSVRSSTSWRSLLGTLGFGYLGAFLMFVISSPLIIIVALVLWVLLQLVDALILRTGVARMVGAGTFLNAWRIAACIVQAAAFFGAAKLFLNMAEQRVSDLERTRHWKYEPKRPRLGRRKPARPRPYR